MTRKLFSFFPILFIILIAFLLRGYALASVAPGVSIDEVDYSLNAKSFVLTGKDLANKITPLQVLLFRYPGTDDTKAELPYLLHIPFDGIFPFSLPLARLPYVVMSVGSVLLLFLIAKELLGKRIGIIAGFIGAINPYLVILGRTSYEVVPAAFLFLLSLFVLLKARGAKILLAFPVMLCAFYAYIGTKLLFVPFMLLSCFFAYYYVQKKKDGKYYLALSFLIVAFIGVYLLLLHVNHTGSRFDQLLLPNSLRISQTVDAGRKASLNASIDTIVFNKFTVYGKLLVGNFIPLFSADYLFMTGDGFLRIYNHGALYYIDLVFLLIGLVYLLEHKKKIGLTLIAFIVIATLPQVVFNSHGTAPNYAHGTLIFPFFVIFIAAGIEGLIVSIKQDFVRKAVIVGIISVYTFSLLVFVQAYFFQYPLQGQDDYQTRLLSRYISLAALEGKPVFVMAPVSVNHFKKYLFYSNALNKNTIGGVKQAFISANIHLGTVSFISCAEKPVFPKNTIVIEDAICGNSDFMSHVSIPLVGDGGTAYKIYQDTICKGFGLKRYPIGLTLSQFAVESMPRQAFCENFITSF